MKRDDFNLGAECMREEAVAALLELWKTYKDQGPMARSVKKIDIVKKCIDLVSGLPTPEHPE